MTIADASLPFQKAILSALKTANIAGQRIYDAVPTSPTFPYVSFGPFDVLTEEADEYEGSDSTLQIDGWSRATGSVEAKQLGRAIRAALHGATLPLDENQRLVALTVPSVRYTNDPDGLTSHVIVTVRARTEPSA